MALLVVVGRAYLEEIGHGWGACTYLGLFFCVLAHKDVLCHVIHEPSSL